MTWKNKAMIIGAGIGTLAGLGAALLYIRSVEDSGREEPASIGTGEGLMLVISIFSLIRQVARLAD
jgi:hypothetical protein